MYMAERGTAFTSVPPGAEGAVGRVLPANTNQPLPALAWDDLEDRRRETRRLRHHLWWRWVGASVVAYFALLVPLTAVMGLDTSPSQAEPRSAADYSDYLVYLVPAVLEWLVLRRLVPDAWRWPVATLAGCVVGAVVFTIVDVIAGDLTPPAERRWPDAATAFIDLLAVGSAQAFVLRRVLMEWPQHPKPGRWVWWLALAIVAGLAAGAILVPSPESGAPGVTLPNRWVEVLVAALVSILGGVLLAWPRASILSRILYPTPRLGDAG
jgi:hypothetical protein